MFVFSFLDRKNRKRNVLELTLEVLQGARSMTLDGIVFKDTALITATIDNMSIGEFGDFGDSLVVLDELVKSCAGTGKYLIFTCACGIADDAGWELIEVVHRASEIDWIMQTDQKPVIFSFSKKEYVSEVERVVKIIEEEIIQEVEPTQVFLPEN
jgi:hypothetical protein